MFEKKTKKAEKKPDVKKGLKVLASIGVACLIIVLVAGVWAVASLVWGWVVPDVFAGAVEQGLLPAKITMWQVAKLWILFWIIGLRSTTFSGKGS